MSSRKNISLVTEAELRVWVDGSQRFAAVRTPGAEKALAMGLCLGAGLVRNLSDVRELSFAPDVDPDRVDIFRRPGLEERSDAPGPFTSDAVLDLKKAPDLVRALFDCQKLRGITRSTHAALLCDRSFSPAFSAEDVSRQSAMDKVLGAALMAGRLESLACALLTCRINCEAVLKFARAGISILASVSRPTAAAVETARELGQTLVLLGDAGSVLVFSGEQRIVK